MVIGSTPLHQATFVIIDLETTGASPKKGAAITEIGAVKVKSGEYLGHFESFVNPLTPIPEYITQMTGISDLMLATAPVIDEIFPTFLEFAGGDSESILVAHNAQFDLSFLKSAAKELDIKWPRYKTLDTVTIARLLDRAGGGGRGRGRGVSRGTARPARREGDARAVAAVRGGGGAQGDPAGEGVDANDGKRPEFAVRNAHRTTSPRS